MKSRQNDRKTALWPMKNRRKSWMTEKSKMGKNKKGQKLKTTRKRKTGQKLKKSEISKVDKNQN